MKGIRIIFTLILAVLLVSSCMVRKPNQESAYDKLTYVSREGWGDIYGYAYIELPQTKILVYEKRSLLEAYGVTDRAIAEAEEKLIAMLPENYNVFEEGMGVDLFAKNGILNLIGEIIVYSDHPSIPLVTGEEGETYYSWDGCGVVHEHLFFEVPVGEKLQDNWPTTTSKVVSKDNVETTVDEIKVEEAVTTV